MNAATVITAAVLTLQAVVAAAWVAVQVRRLPRRQDTTEAPAGQTPEPVAIAPCPPAAAWTADPTAYQHEFLDIADEMPEMHVLFKRIVAVAEKEEKSQ